MKGAKLAMFGLIAGMHGLHDVFNPIGNPSESDWKHNPERLHKANEKRLRKANKNINNREKV